MPKKETKELRNLKTAELQKWYNDLKKEIYELRFQKMTGKLENFSRIKEIRRNVARVLTILKEKEAGGK